MGLEQLEAKSQRQSQVQGQVDSLESSLTTLHDNIGKLTDRLSLVLRSDVPSEQEKGKDKVDLVVLACTIEDFVDSVRSARYKIENLLERIEL